MKDSVSTSSSTSTDGSTSSEAPKHWVRFLPVDVCAEIADGQTLSIAAAAANVSLEHPCGGRGICGKCRVRLDIENGIPTDAEEKLLSVKERAEGYRLSCQTFVRADTEVHLDGTGSIDVGEVLMEGAASPISVDPRCRKTHLILPAPTLIDFVDDERRIRNALMERGIATRPIPARLVKRLPGVVREQDFSITVTTLGDDWITIEAGDTTSSHYGVAVDVGTTTVAVSLHDLNTGEELGRRGVGNRQIACGADVISRISYALQAEDGVTVLHEQIRETIQPVIEELCAKAGIERHEVYQVAAVGNSVMLTLLQGVDPGPIAVSPFIVASTRSQEGLASDSGFDLNPDAVLTTAPLIASYVGGDIIADILACEVYESEKPTLLVDIGTNAEIVLADRTRVLACASPAGPAFEGAEICQGMRAVDGAIERVGIGDGRFDIHTIGDEKPKGLCGSGLIDALACLLEVEAVSDRGRLMPPGEFQGPDWVRALLSEDDEGVRITLWEDGESHVSLWANDIRKLQLAKGAVKVGIKLLCHHWGIAATDLAGILMAGAFGSRLSEESMVRTGMVPHLPGRPIRYVGNTAWAGAKMLLLSRAAAFQADEIRRQTEYHELSGSAGFQMEYGMAMLFDEIWECVGLES